eukprot:GGOE01062060.1.p1 GENE.GGOE01062060.1~~GGOE01062060.1.p1  ORF type:complete len:535 (-),score=83.43 GGOE01062060.1:328-1905(-)
MARAGRHSSDAPFHAPFRRPTYEASIGSNEDAIASLDELIGNEISQFKGRNGWGVSRVKPVFGALGEGWAVLAQQARQHLSTSSHGPEPLDPTHLSSLSSSVGASSASTPSPSSPSHLNASSQPHPLDPLGTTGSRHTDDPSGPRAQPNPSPVPSSALEGSDLSTATANPDPGRKGRSRREPQEPPRIPRTPITIESAALPPSHPLASCTTEVPPRSHPSPSPKQKRCRSQCSPRLPLPEGESVRNCSLTPTALPTPNAVNLAMAYEGQGHDQGTRANGDAIAQDWGLVTLELLNLATRIVTSDRGAAFSSETRLKLSSCLKTLNDTLGCQAAPNVSTATASGHPNEGTAWQSPGGSPKAAGQVCAGGEQRSRKGSPTSPRSQVVHPVAPSSPPRRSPVKPSEATTDSPPTKVIRHRTLRSRATPSPDPKGSGPSRPSAFSPAQQPEAVATASPRAADTQRRGRHPSFMLEEKEEEEGDVPLSRPNSCGVQKSGSDDELQHPAGLRCLRTLAVRPEVRPPTLPSM